MKRTVKIFIWITFVIYCAVLFSLLFIDMRVRFTLEGISAHFAISNLVPFKTICLYIKRAIEGRINVGTAVTNLVGNLIAFLPLGCYLPCLFKGMRKLWRVILLSLGIILTVELFQPLICVGVFDVDDIILNLTGAIVGFLAVNITPVKAILQRFHIYS